jgi:hypothetical protein
MNRFTVLRGRRAAQDRMRTSVGEDRTDPHARELDIARGDPPAGVSPDAAAAEVRDVLNSIGYTYSECRSLEGLVPSLNAARPTYFSGPAFSPRSCARCRPF